MTSIRASNLDSKMLQSRAGFKIPVANATRWNSQLIMIDTFLKVLDKDSTIQDALSAFQVHGKFDFRDIKVIRELVMVLKPFQEATDEWQKDFQSVGTVIPAYFFIRVYQAWQCQSSLPVLRKEIRLRPA